MTDPDSPASVAALSLGASVPDGADAAGAPAEPRAEERDVATPSERAAENWFSGIQTTVDFGAAFTDPVTGKSMGAIGEASAAEGTLNKGHRSEEKPLIIEKVGSREVQGWGVGAGLTVSWIQQKIDPSLIDKGPRISDKSDFRFPIGRGKGRIGNDNIALDVKVSFLSVKLRWGPEHREIGVGVSKGGLVAFTTRGRVETTIRTAPPRRYTGGSWDAPR